MLGGGGFGLDGIDGRPPTAGWGGGAGREADGGLKNIKDLYYDKSVLWLSGAVQKQK